MFSLAGVFWFLSPSCSTFAGADDGGACTCRLSIKVYEAEGLVDPDAWGTCDPFVGITLPSRSTFLAAFARGRPGPRLT
eukprot:569113-Rhodomonas_salina.3